MNFIIEYYHINCFIYPLLVIFQPIPLLYHYYVNIFCTNWYIVVYIKKNTLGYNLGNKNKTGKYTKYVLRYFIDTYRQKTEKVFIFYTS